MRPLSRFVLAAAFAAGGLFACAAHAQTRIAQIDGHALELRHGGPPAAPATIVFENGARETLETWDKVIAALGPDAAVFAYNRAGYGNSEDVDGPRDGRAIVAGLRTALRQQGIQPPYVLVGHSLGGLYMQLFARTYPNEVKALVLVDAMYPGAIKKTEEFPLLTRFAKRVFLSRTVSREIDGIHPTGEQILALPAMAGLPVERLINVPKSPGAVRLDFGAFNGGPALMAKIDAMYPNARTTVVDSDHRIQEANPEVVAAAIRRVLAAPVVALRK